MNETPPEVHSIEVEMQVPGTPEEIWDAIATGPGISAWFVHAEVDERQGGTVSLDFGSGLQSSGVVTAWEPPHRFAYEEDWQPSEDAPADKLATEFLVEARAGGTCVVRIVSSVFASGADWDRELEGMREGWQVYLDNVRLYMTYFAGQRSSGINVTGQAPGQRDRAWAALAGALGLPDAAAGEPVAADGGAPALAGIVEQVVDSDHHRGLVVRTETPAPGVALILVYVYQERTFANVHLYLFGDEAPAVVARDEPAWRAWMEEHFPSEH
jgi:uncharacterized protein YndB with AHSA1/START domain